MELDSAGRAPSVPSAPVADIDAVPFEGQDKLRAFFDFKSAETLRRDLVCRHEAPGYLMCSNLSLLASPWLPTRDTGAV